MGAFAEAAAAIEKSILETGEKLLTVDNGFTAVSKVVVDLSKRVSAIEGQPPTDPPPDVPNPPPPPADGRVLPTISGSKVIGGIGGIITRVEGSVPGHTPYQGRWYVNGPDGTEIGGQATQKTEMIPVGAYAVYRSWHKPAAGGADVILDSLPYGPFVAGTSSPAPTPNPTGPRLWTRDEVAAAIASSTGTNEGAIANIQNGGAGWKRGASVAMGSEWRPRGMPSWAPRGNVGEDVYWPHFTLWGVLFNAQGANNSDVWVEMRKIDFQLRFKNEVRWTRFAMSGDMGGMLFNRDLTAPMSPGVDITKRAGTEGGTISVAMVNDSSPHFWCSPTNIFVARVADIEAVMVSIEHRIDPRSRAGGSVLIDVGGDPKRTTGGNNADGVPWYPGFGVSRAEYVGFDWRKTSMINVLGGIDQPVGRCISQQNLFDFPPAAL